jgi:hypothetical protein
MKYLVLLLALTLAGCDQYYRYPCQDPENWDSKQCKKPLCEVNRDCPELIFKAEEGSTMNNLIDATPEPKKGGCK